MPKTAPSAAGEQDRPAKYATERVGLLPGKSKKARGPEPAGDALGNAFHGGAVGALGLLL